MIKVLQMGMTDNLGGIESYLVNYYRGLDKSKIQFDFTNIYPNKLCFQDELESYGAKVYKISSYYKHPLKYIKDVKKIIKNNDYDIIHCNMNSAAMLFPLIAAKLAGAKVIIAHSHNNSSDKGFIKSFLHNVNKHFIPFLANNYFACSEEAGKWFYSKKVLKSDKFKVIKNSIDTKKFKFSESIRKSMRKSLNIDSDTFVVGHVGRFFPQKNHTFLIDIFNDVCKLNSNSKLVLIGIGDLQEEIKNKVKELGLEDKVLFLNNRNDVNEVMMAMDVFVLPSLYEGLGIVLVEAQASGLPVITTDEIPSIVKVTDNYKTISLSKSSKVWAKEVIKVKDSERTFTINNPFDIDVCIKELSSYYDEMKRIKICHFVNGLVSGGVEKVILNYFSNMENASDYDLHVITQGESDPKCVKEFEKLNFTIHTVTKKSESLIKNYKDIKEILKKEKFDIVHTHMTATNFFPLLYSRLCGVRVRISHSHLSNDRISLSEKVYILLTRLVSNKRFACSNDAAKYLFGKNKKVTILNNAINLDKFKYDEDIRNIKRKEIGIKNDSIVIGHVGRFVEQKNHEFIINLFNELHNDNSKYHLVLVGIGELEDKIKNKVKELGLEESVTFLEARNDVNELMSAFDMFILPSLFEGLGIVLIEAQVSGLTCFASANTPKEVLVTKNIKLLNLDLDLWKKEIKKVKVFKRRDYIKEISKNGFEIKEEAKKLDSIYKKLV